jgi:hypothetical protein
MTANGANPMRWDCNRGGNGRNCFNLWKRPKLAVFAGCFPGRINFGDIDGCAEIGRALALLEWKSAGALLQTAQSIMLRNITLDMASIAFVVEGCAKEMHVERWRICWRGKFGPWMDGGLDALKSRIQKWADWAEWRRRANPNRVHHRMFGAGTIAFGDDISLTVDFDRIGRKRIKHAYLQRHPVDHRHPTQKGRDTR